MSLPRPEITPADPWLFPTPTTRTLPNGLRTMVFDLPGQHVVSAILVIDLPLSLELPELEGIATIALRASDEGTIQHPGQSLLDALESAGAAYEGSASASATICSIDVPSTRLARALELFGEIVQHPSYDVADVERHVALRTSEIEQTMTNPSSLAALAVRAVTFDRSSRDSRPQGGTRASVAKVTPDLVRGFHDRHWRAEGSTLILAGDLFGTDVNGLVERAFGSWDRGAGPALHVVPLPSSEPVVREGKPVVHLVDLPGAVQTELRVAGLGVDRTSMDFAPLQIAAMAMGGSFGSRLNSLLREDLGYTYGVHFSVAPARLGGTWAVSCAVRTEVAVDALQRTLDLMALDEPFTDEEVRDAVNQQLGIAPLRYDTAGAIASQAATLAAAGWGPEFVNLHFSRLAAVTPTTASAAYRRIVAPQSSRLVLVGDAAVLTPQLEAAGFVVEPMAFDAM